MLRSGTASRTTSIDHTLHPSDRIRYDFQHQFIQPGEATHCLTGTSDIRQKQAWYVAVAVPRSIWYIEEFLDQPLE